MLTSIMMSMSGPTASRMRRTLSRSVFKSCVCATCILIALKPCVPCNAAPWRSCRRRRSRGSSRCRRPAARARTCPHRRCSGRLARLPTASHSAISSADIAMVVMPPRPNVVVERPQIVPDGLDRRRILAEDARDDAFPRRHVSMVPRIGRNSCRYPMPTMPPLVSTSSTRMLRASPNGVALQPRVVRPRHAQLRRCGLL